MAHPDRVPLVDRGNSGSEPVEPEEVRDSVHASDRDGLAAHDPVRPVGRGVPAVEEYSWSLVLPVDGFAPSLGLGV